MGDSRESTPELRCVAPLAVGGRLVGPCMLITNGAQTIAVASSEVLRQAGEPLVIVTRLDGTASLPIKAWQLAQHSAIGIVALEEGTRFTPEVYPLHLASLSAAVETRGAPAALVTVRSEGGAFARTVVGVTIELDDGGGMSDDVMRIAKPVDPLDAPIDGAPIFAWMPPDPVLGRGSEVIAIAIGVRVQNRIELISLEDAGRALPWAEQTPPPSNELVQVAGEIVKKEE
jgi:hypothetical protein